MPQRNLNFTDEDIESLKKAIARGAQTVSYGDRSVTYRSLDEMIRLLNLLRSSKAQPPKKFYASFSTGRMPR